MTYYKIIVFWPRYRQKVKLFVLWILPQRRLIPGLELMKWTGLKVSYVQHNGSQVQAIECGTFLSYDGWCNYENISGIPNHKMGQCPLYFQLKPFLCCKMTYMPWPSLSKIFWNLKVKSKCHSINSLDLPTIPDEKYCSDCQTSFSRFNYRNVRYFLNHN